MSEFHEKIFFEQSDILKTFLQLFTCLKPGFLFSKKCWRFKLKHHTLSQQKLRAKMASNNKILN